MAIINQCKYCGADVLDAWWHDRCRIQHLEALLYDVREGLGEHAPAHFPLGVFQRLRSEDIPSALDQLEKIQEEVVRAQAQKIWKANLQTFIVGEIEEFRRRNPEPNMQTY